MNREQHIIETYEIDTSGEPPYQFKASRWKSLPYLFANMGVKVGAEIGVETGKYSDCLLRKIPGLKLYCIDPWEEYPTYRENMQPLINKYYKNAIKLLEGRCEIIRKYSMDAVKDFEDESLDFVFIDGNHDFQNCTNDIAEWSKKVKKGGVISGHDFCDEICGHERIDVESCVRGWTKANDIKVWFLTHGVERRKCWLWIKQ